MSLPESIQSLLDAHDVSTIELWFTDILGGVKSISVPAARLTQVVADGASFDGSSIDGFARVAESDMRLAPDLSTFRILPWNPRSARVICDAYTPQGEPFIGDPRSSLRRALTEASNLDLRFDIGVELEFFLFRTDANGQTIACQPYDDASYFDITSEPVQALRERMIDALLHLGIQVRASHSEIGRGQHEIELESTDALQAADHIITARIVLKTIAGQAGASCTFMPRPCADLPGSGLHTHQSLHRLADGSNAFTSSEDEYGLSELARMFLAGQLQHARAMTAVLAPLVNSYKRLGKSFEAPTAVSWAHVNRAALIRVPVAHGPHEGARLELRCPDPSTNPYLAAAVMLKAGLDGVHNRLTLPQPHEETLLSHSRGQVRRRESLPVTLDEALDALREDDVILDALGPYISDRFLEAKQQEVDEYNQTVTAWEISRYLKH